MAKPERCSICGVSVKAENLRRHLDETHPRHPDTPALREQIKKEPRYEPSSRPVKPFRFRRIHIAIAGAIILLGLGAFVAAPYLGPSTANFNVDSCINDASVVYHIHPYLSIFIQGSRYPIPYDIGITPTCTKPVHTHNADAAHGGYDPATDPAIIHVESPVARGFTVGDFFHVWGQVFTPTQILSYANDGTNVVSMTVDGTANTQFGNLVFQERQQIVISFGPSA